MGVTPGGVHDESARIRANGFGESFGTFLDDDVSPADFAWDRGVERWAVGVFPVVERRDDDLVLEAWLALHPLWSGPPRKYKLADGRTTWPLMELPLTTRSPR